MRALISRGAKSQKWNTQKRNEEGPKFDELEESELAPEGKHWKSIVNKVQNQRQKGCSPDWNRAPFLKPRGENSAQNFLAFLAIRERVLYTVPGL